MKLEEKCVKNLSFEKISKQGKDYFEIDEIIGFLEVLKNNYLHSIWFKLLYTFGMTISELIYLQVGDIDLEEKIICIRTSKNHKLRYLKLPGSLAVDLISLTCQRDKSEILFLGRKGNVNRRTIQKLFEKIEQFTGKKVTIGKLRRTTAVHLNRNGWSDKMISHYMGHSNCRSTRQMLKANREYLPERIFPLDEMTQSAA